MKFLLLTNANKIRNENGLSIYMGKGKFKILLIISLIDRLS